VRTAPAALCALAVLLSAAAAGAPAAAAAPIPFEPPDGASLVPGYLGHAARPRPVAAPRVPRHPFMAPNGLSNVHDDGYMTDTYTWSGPLGRSPVVTSQAFGGLGLCGITIAFDRLRRPVTICISPPDRQELRVLDRSTLATVASHQLPPRVIPPNVNPFVASGGAYFYLDDRDRAVVSTGRRVQVIALSGRGAGTRLRLVRDYDLRSVIPLDDQLNSALPDWSGRLWFVSRYRGIVGMLDRRTGRVLDSRVLGDEIGNSFTVGEDGGVYVVTDGAMYRLDARGGRIRITWRRAYRNAGVHKPGQLTTGSGTTPTLMGRRYVAITDNADPMNVVVYRRAARVRGRRLVCEQPVFRRGASATENSLIGTGRSLVVENNHGYAPPPDATSGGGATSPGLERVDVLRGGRACRTVWRSRERAPSVVPKLSLANGLVYTVTKPPGTPDAWYLAALDFRTGATVWKRLLGTGLWFNNHYAGISISPGGAIFLGVLGGTVRVADRG
jgi:hypothetical protein